MGSYSRSFVEFSLQFGREFVTLCLDTIARNSETLSIEVHEFECASEAMTTLNDAIEFPDTIRVLIIDDEKNIPTTLSY